MTEQILQENRTTRKNLIMITGATGGLGKAFAVECASRGWDLFLTDLRTEPLQVLANALSTAYRVGVCTQACDLTDPAHLSALFERIRADGRQFWGLINVAGIDFEGPFYQQSRQQIRTIVRLNIEGPLEMIHGMLAFRYPEAPFRIINVSSLAAFYPMPVKATYAASKRFLMDFSLALRNELRHTGVTVTVLCPAGLPTTPDCIQAIDAQGLLGQLTTQNIGAVANQTLNSALKGQAVCIPGALNRFIQFAGALIPTSWVVNLIGSRWKSAQQKQPAQYPLAHVLKRSTAV